MINLWADLAKMRRDFPIGSEVIIDEDIEEVYWDEEVGGKIAQVTGYDIEEGLLELVTEAGKEIALYPDEVERHYPSQIC